MKVKYLNHKNPTIIECLGLLAVKNDVFITELYQALVTARENGKANCEELYVEYRGKEKDQAIFLITKAEKVVIQFQVDEEFLHRTDLNFEKWMDLPKIRKQIAKKNPSPTFSTLIQNLRHGMKKVNVEAEVLEAQKPQLIHTQYGTNVILTNALIADETGKVKLCLWGDQAKNAVVGDIIKINNASVRTFKGERHLNLGKTGTFNILKSKMVRIDNQLEHLSKKLTYA